MHVRIYRRSVLYLENSGPCKILKTETSHKYRVECSCFSRISYFACDICELVLYCVVRISDWRKIRDGRKSVGSFDVNIEIVIAKVYFGDDIKDVVKLYTVGIVNGCNMKVYNEKLNWYV